MKIISFKEQIEYELGKMSRKEMVFFAWLCAVRALPYLGTKGHFNFWDKTKRMKYIFAVLRALDTSVGFYKLGLGVALIALNTVRTAAFSITNASASAHAAQAVANAANAAFDDYVETIYPSSAPVNATVIVIAAAGSAITAAGEFMPNTLLADLIAIKNKQKIEKFDISLYGDVWHNFHKALENAGCTYWSRLYKDIFENGFMVDKVALERRINVPPSIQEKGAAEVAIYLENLEKGAKHLNESRIIILGEKGSGKTSLALRLKDPGAPMPTDDQSTDGVVTSLWQPDNEDMNVHIWDFAGHTITHAVHRFFLAERCLYILVYDGRTESRNRTEYWLSQMKNYGGNSEVMILVNQRDSNIPDIPIRNLQEKYPIIGFYTLSIKDDKQQLEDFRQKVIGYIKNNPSWNKKDFPVNYFNVKLQLEQFFKDNPSSELISINKFNQIAKANDVNDPGQLLTQLDILGICLRYKNLDAHDTLVLNPEWISHGIYSIIKWLRIRERYRITFCEFADVFQNETVRYPAGEKHTFLFELMKNYELAYETADNKYLIIPHLLEQDRPVALPDFSGAETLEFWYKAELPMPPNQVARFIVRHNTEIKDNLVWRFGVVLENKNGALALVREWEEERKITVSVTGNAKTTYLNELRESMNSIFDDVYKLNESGKPEIQYKIEGFEKKPMNAAQPLMVPVSQIVAHASKNIQYPHPYTHELIDLQPVVINYNINITNLTMASGGNDVYMHSQIQTFNFYNCNLTLQSNLNDLAGTLRRKGETDEAEVLEDAAQALEDVKSCEKEEVKKKGILNKLKRIVDDLGDEQSKLYKTVNGIKHGVSIAKDIVKAYNEIFQWIG